jgi:hypothetical protein
LLKGRDWLAGKGGFNNGSRVVIAVESEGQTIYVNPEGHDYARYVGFPLPAEQ